MTKVECWSISIDRSCHIGPSQTSNCFDLNYPGDTLYISKRCTIKPISRFNRSLKNMVPKIDMSKAGPITPIPNPK